MKKFSVIVLLIIALINTGCFSSRKSGWETLFNGRDLEGWTPKIRGYKLDNNFANTFSVKNGAIHVDYSGYDTFNARYGHIFYKQKYSAYLLNLEYRFIGEQARHGEGWAFRNSGIMLHCQAPETMAIDQDFPISLEAQFLGGNGKEERSTGNLCTPGTNVVREGKLFTPHCVNSSSKTYHGDQWVKASLLVLGDSVIKHIINGDTVMVYEKPQYDGTDKWVQHANLKGGELIREGYISLQSESHPVEFRNIKLFDLSGYLNDRERLVRKLRELK